jgi:hypothetical protein
MADFSPAFAVNGERRLPNATEIDLGFQCGAGQRELFNALFHRIEAELGHLIAFAGLTGADSDLTQVRKAIEALIAAASGAGDTSQFLLVSQARARLPIMPEVLNVDGRIVVTAPVTGTVRVPGGVAFQHRGIFPMTTVQTDLPTDPSKTYHLRWNPTDGYTLRDLASLVYNPGALAEANSAFDSKYDDMLIARVITNSSNVAAISNLANKPELQASDEFSGPPTSGPSPAYAYTYANTLTLNWSRTPRLIAVDGQITQNGGYNEGHQGWISARSKTRYAAAATVAADFYEGGPLPVGVQGRLSIAAMG